jgi:UDP-N-acetyl-2-amino-2-deoxyglucuronate dehydrogenase
MVKLVFYPLMKILCLKVKEKVQRKYRSITVYSKDIEFSTDFTNLHNLRNEEIIKVKDFGLIDSE